MYKIVGNKIFFDNGEMFDILKPIGFGSHSDIYKARIGNDMCAIKKYNWIYNEDLENIERKIDINIDSYVTPVRLLYISGKFDGYLMSFCKGKDLEKRKLDISIDEFSQSTVKLMEDTDKLSEIKYNIFDTFITNVMYDDGFKMVDTDDYPYNPNMSFDEISKINTERLNKMLSDIFIKNANLGNLYFSNVEFQKLIKRCKDGEILFKDMFDLLCSIANNETNGELTSISEVGKVLSKIKKMWYKKPFMWYNTNGFLNYTSMDLYV